MRPVIYVAFLLFSTSLLLFALLEAFPALLHVINLDKIQYFAINKRYLPDPLLEFVPRKGSRTGTRKYQFKGAQYNQKYEIETPTINFLASYNELGFRRNSAPPPYDVLVIGDSYIEIGETDDDTLSERLRKTSGLSTFNLGRASYGPNQYLHLLRRHGPAMKPKYALFCFFDGNDITDIWRYARFANGLNAKYAPLSYSFFGRYWSALRHTVGLLKLRTRIRKLLLSTSAAKTSGNNTIHPSLGMVALGKDKVVMAFKYMNDTQKSAENLLASEEWTTLRAILEDFQAFSLETGIKPVVVYLPTKFQTYADLITPESGSQLLKDVQMRRAFNNSSMESLTRITEALGIQLINLMPEFRKRADRGELLYYPFDNHWNSAGREVAAQFIAPKLAGSKSYTRK